MLIITKKEIKIPKNIPNLIIIVGPCRVGTTALANIFSKVGLTVYMQPIKSARRAKEAGEKIVQWKILEGNIVVAKETLGPKTEAEFFDPIKILLKAGYPKEKLILIPIIRDSRKTLASWRSMWISLNLEKFVQTYKLVLEIKNKAESMGIKTIPYVHEVTRDQSSYAVIRKLFKKIGLKKSISKNVIDWTKGRKFGKDSNLKFYDAPSDRFVKEVKSWETYKYQEEPYLQLSSSDEVFIKKNKVLEDIYEEFRKGCQKALGLKIRPF